MKLHFETFSIHQWTSIVHKPGNRILLHQYIMWLFVNILIQYWIFIASLSMNDSLVCYIHPYTEYSKSLYDMNIIMMIWYDMIWYGTLRYDTTRYDMIRCAVHLYLFCWTKTFGPNKNVHPTVQNCWCYTTNPTNSF